MQKANLHSWSPLKACTQCIIQNVLFFQTFRCSSFGSTCANTSPRPVIMSLFLVLPPPSYLSSLSLSVILPLYSNNSRTPFTLCISAARLLPSNVVLAIVAPVRVATPLFSPWLTLQFFTASLVPPPSFVISISTVVSPTPVSAVPSSPTTSGILSPLSSSGSFLFPSPYYSQTNL